MALALPLTFLSPVVSAAKPAAVTEVRADIRPAAPERAGRNFFRPLTAAPVAPSAAVTHPARPAVRAAPKRVAKKAPVRTATRKRAETGYAVPAGASGSAAVRLAMSALGRPYRFGAAGPSSFDCSGLVMWIYAHLGVRLPHKASAFYGVGRAVPYSQIQPGDILILNGGSHAAVAIGNGLMIHAPHTGDHVRIAKITGFSAARRLV